MTGQKAREAAGADRNPFLLERVAQLAQEDLRVGLVGLQDEVGMSLDVMQALVATQGLGRGSVRARASKYNLCSRTCGDVPSRGFQDGQHRHGAAEELEPAASGGNGLVVAGGRAEEVAQFIVSPAEPSR